MKAPVSISHTSHAVIVDDEVEIVAVIAEILKEGGFQVTTFTDSLEALDWLLKNSVDLLLTDFNMPRLSGQDLAEQVRVQWPDLPIIMVSGHVHGNQVLKDIYAILQKPFDPNLVIQTALHASQKYQLAKLTQKVLDLLMYQFADLDDYLKLAGKDDIRIAIRSELKSIQQIRSNIRSLARLERKISNG